MIDEWRFAIEWNATARPSCQSSLANRHSPIANPVGPYCSAWSYTRLNSRGPLNLLFSSFVVMTS